MARRIASHGCRARSSRSGPSTSRGSVRHERICAGSTGKDHGLEASSGPREANTARGPRSGGHRGVGMNGGLKAGYLRELSRAASCSSPSCNTLLKICIRRIVIRLLESSTTSHPRPFGSRIIVLAAHVRASAQSLLVVFNEDVEHEPGQQRDAVDRVVHPPAGPRISRRVSRGEKRVDRPDHVERCGSATMHPDFAAASAISGRSCLLSISPRQAPESRARSRQVSGRVS
jgi:hypothetical protein